MTVPGQDAPEPPQRVRVEAPRRLANAAPVRASVAQEVSEHSQVGEVFVRSLIRSQLRLAAVVAGAFALVLAGCWLLATLLPGLLEVRLGGIPLPWLVLGVGIYPVVCLCAWLFVRAAARNEARYLDLVGEK
ncbi:hypothetical protein [Arthrobacter sp. 35W]|uniref:hypothetical protein n=1 Tax=Arthrobacter sp. 35W TaxID=1132441 RepID=UPI0003FA76A9|nr:hypothetical protein [Arthrobacter sp. 35W]